MKKTEILKLIKKHDKNLPFIKHYWEVTLPEQEVKLDKNHSIDYNTRGYASFPLHKAISTAIDFNFFNNHD